MRPVVWTCGVLGGLGLAAVAHAVPVTVRHQGRLLDSAGTPLNTPAVLEISLYDSATGGTVVWTDTFAVTPEDGFYAVTLGSSAPLDGADLAGDRWLEIVVDGTVLGGRQKLTPVPQAVHADTAGALGSGGIAPHPSGGLRIGNTVINAWSGAVPTAFNGSGYASGPLQMKTALTCGNGQGQSYMWHIEFAGHDYLGASPFRVVSVGYSQSTYPDEIQDLGTVVDYGDVRVAPYCSTDDFLSFEFTLARAGQWHASDMTVSLLHGGSSYERNATDGFAVTALREGSRY